MSTEIYLYIKEIRTNSLWGKHQTIENYRKYVSLEFLELKNAIKLNDKMNIIEELADVYMMLVFYWQELTKTGCVIPKESKKLFIYVKKKSMDYGVTIDTLEKIIYDKLERRYPKQLSIFKDIEPEESYWKRKKKYYKMLDFCTCTNPECLNYHKPYNGSNLRVIESKSGQSVYIICSVCKKKLSLKKDVFFYGISSEYPIALKAAIDYFSFDDNLDVCKKYDIKSSTMSSIKKRCIDNYDVFKKIADKRYPKNNLPSTPNTKNK